MTDRCRDAVERLTEFLDGSLAPEETRRLEVHLRECEGCRAALDQWRATIGLAARLDPAALADLDPYVRNRLLALLTEARRR